MRRLCVPPRRTRALTGVLLAALTVLALTLVPSSFGIVQLDSRTPGRGLTGRRVLTPTAAWAKAAGAAGHSISKTQVTPFGRLPNGSTQVIATGFSGSETVQPVAFGTARLGALRAYDTTVTKTTD